MNKPSIPKGTRDFGPLESTRRGYIFDTIKKVYERYGFMPIETPAMEILSTLTGKYGEEGDQLIFKIINSGDYLSKANEEVLTEKNSKALISQISEKALRYDLTVPTARYVVMHRNEISFPFKRYQIQPVWRADKPQKGRYREFYQCDADVIGSPSLLNEVDFIRIIDDVFSTLGFNVMIKINNRKILSGICQAISELDKLTEITVALDKLDKIGEVGVVNELTERGLSGTAVEKLLMLMRFKGNSNEKIIFLKEFLSSSEHGQKGVEEIEFVFDFFKNNNLPTSSIELDLTLARGLNYYTGAIIEVKVNDERTTFSSSICGGGRYDDLTGIFGMPGVSGIGISFGADRIYDVMEDLKLFPESDLHAAKVLFINFGDKEVRKCMEYAAILRKNDINAEVYPDTTKKIGKQMDYAISKNIKYVALVESAEIENNKIRLRNISSREEITLDIDAIVKYF